MKQNLFALLLILLAASMAGRLHSAGTARENLQGCRSNLKNIATALEMYASDYGGQYPASLHSLLGPYLKRLPTCPSTGCDYSETYRYTSQPDSFSFGCAGRHHGEPASNREYHRYSSARGYPWYDAETGCMCHD